MRLILIIFMLQLSSRVNSSILSEEIQAYHNETESKAEHASTVVNKIYNAFRQWFFTITFCEFTYFENRILKYTENMDYGYPVLLLNGCPDENKSNRTKRKPKINIHGKTAYVITSEVLSTDVSEYIVEALSKTGVFNPISTVIFVLNQLVELDSYFLYTIRNHFQSLWSKGITHSVVMVSTRDGLRIYTYNYFFEELRDVTHVKDISYFLSHEYNNLYKHELRLSVFKKIYMYDDNIPVKCNARLAMTVMEQLNATCKAVPPRDSNTVGDLLEDGTATGVTADLIDGYTDLELNSRILKNSYYGFIETTYPMTQDELCFLVKNYERQSTFMTTLQLITVNMLVTFMFNFVGLTVVALIAHEIESKVWNIRGSREKGVTVLELVKCFIRQTADIHFFGPVYRGLVWMIMIYSLVVNCVIDGIITTAITYPRYKSELDKFTELVHSNLTIGVHNRDIRMFERSIDIEAHKQLQNRIEIINDKKIKEIIDNRLYQYAILLRKTEAVYISNKLSNMVNGRPLFRIMQECPVPCSIVYGLRYGSPFLSQLNKLLHHLNQGGILKFWTKAEEFKESQTLHNEDGKNLQALKLIKLKEVFVVCAFGLLFSTLVFFIEILYNYYAKRKENKPSVITEHHKT